MLYLIRSYIIYWIIILKMFQQMNIMDKSSLVLLHEA